MWWMMLAMSAPLETIEMHNRGSASVVDDVSQEAILLNNRGSVSVVDDVSSA